MGSREFSPPVLSTAGAPRIGDPWPWVASAAQRVANEAGNGGYTEQSLRLLRAALKVALSRNPKGSPPHGGGEPAPVIAGKRLTEREIQVLSRVALGKTNLAISQELYVSVDTVKTHVYKLLKRIGAANRAQAVAMAYRDGVLPR